MEKEGERKRRKFYVLLIVLIAFQARKNSGVIFSNISKG